MNMSCEQGLFRAEALEARRLQSLGRIQINTPPGFWAVTVCALGLVAAAAAYLSLGRYTRRADVQGMLVPAAGLVTLSATAPGQVVKVDIGQGGGVSVGQTLAEFNNPLASAELGNTLAFVTAELEIERKALQHDLVTQRALAMSQSAALRKSVTSLRAQLVQIASQLEIQRREAMNMAALLKRITPLSRQGIISIYDLQQQQDNTFNAELQVKSLERERLSLAQQLAEARQRLAQVPLTLATQLNDTQNKLAQIEQALAQNEAQREWVIKAPQSGVVGTLLIKPGEMVNAGEPLLTIVPRGSRLEAQLLVPSASIGFVRSGQRVVLRYQAFPYEKFGLHFGVVDQVSRNALSPMEIATSFGEQTKVPLYRVTVRLQGQAVQAYGHRVPLRPGMTVQADILLDSRRLIEWLLEPLYGFRSRMFLGAPSIPGDTPSPRRSAGEMRM